MKFLLALSVFVAMCCFEVDEFLVTCSADPVETTTNIITDCEDGDTIILYVRVWDWVNADSVNYNWSNGTPFELITCDYLNGFGVCPNGVWVDHEYFWSDDIKPMRFVVNGGFHWGAVWLPPSPVNDSIGYTAKFAAYHDALLTNLAWGPSAIWPLYHNGLPTDPPTNFPGYHDAGKETPNICP